MKEKPTGLDEDLHGGALKVFFFWRCVEWIKQRLSVLWGKMKRVVEDEGDIFRDVVLCEVKEDGEGGSEGASAFVLRERGRCLGAYSSRRLRTSE